MHRGLFMLAAFILIAVSGPDANAALKFGTRDSVQHLKDLSVKGPKGEALSLGYVTTTHSFMLPYKMTGDYVLIVRGAAKDPSGRARDVFHRLPQAKIEQMQRAGALPKPLPASRHTIFDYLMGYLLWWSIPATLAFIGLFSMLGFGRRTRGEARPA
jgi:hypothetical protein